MLPENYVIIQVDHVHDVLRVVFLQELQDFQLDSGLVVVFFLVFHDFHGNVDSVFVVEALQSRSKTTFAEEGLYFKPVADVVVVDNLVVALFVVIAVVVLQLGAPLHFLRGRGPDEENFRVVEDLLLFIVGQLV